uniref:ATP synthase F0 subunit 8 n=1 Tax=Hypnea cryptica TaxID=2546159 RepID=UPI003001F64F|nr:ATP synthase F0 subunit 8 [Hypnea cryptica]
MPQLDHVIIFSQIFWLFIIFSALYIILTHFFLPLFLKSIKLRKQIVEVNSIEVSQLSQKIRAQQVLIKQKLLDNLVIIEDFISESYKFQKHFTNNQQIILIDEKVSMATINYLLYCDNSILKNILLYPKFLNSK